MTVIEYMEKHNLNQHQLARVLGAAQSLVNRATLPDQTFSKQTVELFATIGVELKETDRKKAIEKMVSTKREKNKTKTVNEYKEEHKLSITELADLLEVSEVSVRSYLSGNPTSCAVASRMLKHGINHPVRQRGGSICRKTNSDRKEKKWKSFLKDWQVETVRTLGSSIVSKKHSIEKIVNEFEKFGLMVKVREFSNPYGMEWDRDTHYVVELDK